MRAVYFIMLLWCGALPITANAYEHFTSPDGKFEAYTTADTEDGHGMKLFVRPSGDSESGILLATNGRWLDAQWSPDSHFLAVGDHWDGHINDIYVFGIRRDTPSSMPKATLYAHSPNVSVYDVQWEVAAWNLRHRDILLKKTVKFEAVAGRLRLHIGKHALAHSVWPISKDA